MAEQAGSRQAVPPSVNGELPAIAIPGAGKGGYGEGPNLAGLLAALQTMKAGDFTVRLPGNRAELAGKIADTFNDIISANQRMAQQLELVGQAVGREGKTRTRVIRWSSGAWSI